MAREEYRELLVALTGGLNTSSDPAELDPDELAESTGMEYRPPNIGLFDVLGRTRFDTGGTLAGTNVYGLIYCGFDTTATSITGPRLIAFNDISAFGATVTDSNQFVRINSTGVQFDDVGTFAKGCHYGNDWFFWNGKNYSWALQGAEDTIGLISARTEAAPHGLFAVTSAGFTVQATAFTGASNTIGTFDCWVTELLQDVSDTLKVAPRLESAFNGTVVSVTLSATNMGIKWTYPAISNADFLGDIKFRPYCSMAGGKYPFGFAVGGEVSGNVNVALEALAGTVTTNSTATHLVPRESQMIKFEQYAVVQSPDGVAVPANGHPPKPWDMAVFQDSLCAIDAEDRRILKYSLPDEPHHFPSTYFIPFETDQQDDLTAVVTCNNALLVFASRYGFRVDDLPRASDGDEIFTGRSRAKEPFVREHGCVSPRGAAVFNIFGSGELCLFICRDGIHITDGFKTDYASENLDWASTVDLASLSRSTLLNNPKKHRVEFYYADATTTTSWKRLDFYYYPSLLKQRPGAFPKLVLLGPTDVPGPAATVGIFSNDWRTWTGHDAAGSVWNESTGTDDGANLVDASGTVNKSWKSKTFYPYGFNGESELLNVYTHQSQTTASGSYTVTATFGIDDEQSPFTATATVDNTMKGALPHPDLRNRSQWFNLRGAKNDDGTWQEMNSLTFIVQRPGRVESGKSSV